MQVAVLIKGVPDTSAALSLSGDGRRVRTEGDLVMNPYDEYALEEALRIREMNGGEVVAVSLGGEAAMKVLRTGLAMGADKAVLICEKHGAQWTGRTAAWILAATVERLAPDLILAGKQAVDDDGAQVAERIAQIMGWVHASAVSRLRLESGVAVADREVEEGHYVLELPLPALVTVEKGINTPRYPTLPNLLKAKTRPVQELSVDELGIAPEKLEAGLMVDDLVAARQDRRRMILEGEPSVAVKRLASLLREGADQPRT